MILFHGSPNVVEKPYYGGGSEHNDYGKGFYCTEAIELAKEWACATVAGGYANRYEFDMEGLSVLNLTNGDYNILNWLAVLLENRVFPIKGDLGFQAKEYIIKNFRPNYEEYDVIVGYRADDSYFTFASNFINNVISLKKLEKAMVLGELGIQIVPKSRLAFTRLKYLDNTPVDGAIYHPKRMARDNAAREEYRRVRSVPMQPDEVYMIDILRGEWKNDDPRLQRVVLG